MPTPYSTRRGQPESATSTRLVPTAGRKHFWRGVFDVVGIGIEAVPEFTISSRRLGGSGGECGTKFRKARETGICSGDAGTYHRNFQRDDFIGLEHKVREDKRRVVLCLRAQLVFSARQGKQPENSFRGRSCVKDLPGFQIPQGQYRAGNGQRIIRRAGVANKSVECRCVLRLLARNALRWTRFA